MSDFLDKLAMEVSEWGEVPITTGAWWNRIDGAIVALCDGGHSVITKSQWRQRRKELINEPRDRDAPYWAKWKAQDGDGTWHWHKGDRPRANGTLWDIACGGGVGVASKGKTPSGHVWRTTLKEVNQMDDLKEVKMAWANGETVQRIINTDNGEEWVDWRYSSYLDIESGHDWRVKPKYKTVKQWERKYYNPEIGVCTSVSDRPRNDWNTYEGVKLNWITEQYLVEYEVPV